MKLTTATISTVGVFLLCYFVALSGFCLLKYIKAETDITKGDFFEGVLYFGWPNPYEI